LIDRTNNFGSFGKLAELFVGNLNIALATAFSVMLTRVW
jgi:hypothetical protein